MSTRYTVTVDEKEYAIEINSVDGKPVVSLNGKTRAVESTELGSYRRWERRTILFVDGTVSEVDVKPLSDPDERAVLIGGQEFTVRVEDHAVAQMRKVAGVGAKASVEQFVKSPMPGLIVGIKVEVGSKFVKGQPLVVIEAMKMENVIKAKGDGVVKAIHVTSGKSVEKGEKLLELGS